MSKLFAATIVVFLAFILSANCLGYFSVAAFEKSGG